MKKIDKEQFKPNVLFSEKRKKEKTLNISPIVHVNSDRKVWICLTPHPPLSNFFWK